jgi:hypothetical protein
MTLLLKEESCWWKTVVVAEGRDLLYMALEGEPSS